MSEAKTWDGCRVSDGVTAAEMRKAKRDCEEAIACALAQFSATVGRLPESVSVQFASHTSARKVDAIVVTEIEVVLPEVGE